MSICPRFFVLGFAAAAFVFSGLGFGHAVELGMAGVPKELGATRDYDRIFDGLKASGVSVFYPTFQFVEAPTPQSLGFEVDFLPPCTAQTPAFAALRRTGMRLVIIGDLIYPPDSPLPPLAEDPVRQIIDCAGRNNIYGVASYDEPVERDISLSAVSTLYKRVKQIDPTLPVAMVHAPIILDKARYSTGAGRANYLQQVKIHSQYADVVGFDVYPITRAIANMATPFSGSANVNHLAAIRDYMMWLNREVPLKKRLIVLQGFSYADQFDPTYLARLADAETVSTIRPPTGREHLAMATLAKMGGASLLVWWGTSLQQSETARVWQDLLSITKYLAANP